MTYPITTSWMSTPWRHSISVGGHFIFLWCVRDNSQTGHFLTKCRIDLLFFSSISDDHSAWLVIVYYCWRVFRLMLHFWFIPHLRSSLDVTCLRDVISSVTLYRDVISTLTLYRDVINSMTLFCDVINSVTPSILWRHWQSWNDQYESGVMIVWLMT